jgi:hypothetical protein
LRLCVDYRELNEIIIKNRYYFLFINETFNHIVNVKYFIKFNIIATYNKLRIKKKMNEKLRFARVTKCTKTKSYRSNLQMHRQRFKYT